MLRTGSLIACGFVLGVLTTAIGFASALALQVPVPVERNSR